MTEIVKWAQGKYGFYVDRYYKIGTGWILEPGPIKLARYHAELLRHLFTPDKFGRLLYDVVAWCEPAKSGKSAIAALVSLFMALHGDTNSSIVMASNKRDQASSVMFKSLTDAIGYNPHLPNVDPRQFDVTFRNGNQVKAIPSSSRTEAGARFSLACFDEPWAMIYEDNQRLWSEFKTDPTRLTSLKFAIGYAGYTGESELWEQLLQSGRNGHPVPDLTHITNADGQPACWQFGRQFVFWSHVCRQPWQTLDWQEQQAKQLRPAEYQRMIECRFAEGVGNFVEPSAWQACIDPDHKGLAPGQHNRPVYVGLDLATSAKGDDCALIGVYADQGQIKVAFHKVWKGKDRKSRLKLKQTVYPYLTEKAKQYNLAGVWFDPYQALSLAEDLRAAGLRCIEVQQTRHTRGPKDTALLDLILTRRLVLYQSPDFQHLAAAASAKELGNGLIFLTKASGRSKIDLLIALSNVASSTGTRQQVEVIHYAPRRQIRPVIDYSNLPARFRPKEY